MKITKRQLRRIIKETMIQRQSGLSDIMAQMGGHDIEDDAEYARGYDDGEAGYPIADDATLDYDAGYEDGQRDAGIPSKMDQIDPAPAK